jgi:hypothetical protein
LNGEIESGRLTVFERTVHKYMRIARNSPRSAYLPEAPSIRAALELLSDKEPEEQQGSLIDIETERQARERCQGNITEILWDFTFLCWDGPVFRVPRRSRKAAKKRR